MPQRLMEVLMLARCSHEFAWPRRAADGEYYQICTLCAAEYKYDWSTMRRTERVEPVTLETGIRRSHPRDKRPNWKPRARRLRLDQPVRFRINNTSTWYEAAIENLSQTGLLFESPKRLPLNALLEMVFEMPEEISGQKNRTVVCQGRVIRTNRAHGDETAHGITDEASPAPSKSKEKNKAKDGGGENTPCILAASIVDYKFIR